MHERSDNPWLTKILTAAEVRMLARRLKAMLPPGAASLSADPAHSVESTLRIGSLARRCKDEREASGLTFQQAAVRLKVPQYRLKAIERGDILEFRSDVFAKYQDLLGLHDWVERWAGANPSLARRLGVVIPSRPRRRSPAGSLRARRQSNSAPHPTRTAASARRGTASRR